MRPPSSFDPRTQHPFERDGLWLRARYFLVMIVLAWLLQPLSGSTAATLPGAALVLTAAIIAAVLLLPWRRLPGWARAVPPLAWLVVVALLRHDGGAGISGYATLSLLPVFWFALYGSRRELWIAVIGLLVIVAGPAIALGAPQYPATELRRAVLLGVFAAMVGVAVQGMLTALRDEVARRKRAEQALRDLEALEINDDIVQGLVVAKMALQVGRTDLAIQSVDQSLEAGKRIITRLTASTRTFRRDR